MRLGTPSFSRKLLIGAVLCIILVTFAFLRQSNTISASPHGFSGTVTGSPTVGRTGPDINYSVNTILPNGTTVIALAASTECDWVFVWSDEGTGWVSAFEIALDDESQSLCTQLPSWTNPMSHAVKDGKFSLSFSSNTTSSQKLNTAVDANNTVAYEGYTSGQPTPARTTPDWNAPVNINLPDQTFITIVARNHNCAWVFVRSSMGDGWIPATFVRVTGEVNGTSSDSGKDATAYDLCNLPVWNTGAAQPTATWVAPTATWVAPQATWVAPTATWVAPQATWVAPTATPRPQTGTNGTNNQPTGTNNQPSGTNNQPTGTNNQPSGTNNQPTGTNNQPTGTNNQPSGTNNQPTGTNNVPSGPWPTATPRPQTGTNNLPTNNGGTNRWPTATPRPQTGTNNLPTNNGGTNRLPTSPAPQSGTNSGGTNRLPTSPAPTTGRNIGDPDNWYMGHFPVEDGCTRRIPIHTTDRAPSAGKLQFRTALQAGAMREHDHLWKEWAIWKGDRMTNDLASMEVNPSRYARLWYYRNDTKTWYLLPSQYWHGNNRAESEYGQDCHEGWTASYHTSFSKAIAINKIPR